MRQLKYHEQKLLKKVNFLRWKNEHNLRELQVRAVVPDAVQHACTSNSRGPEQPLVMLSIQQVSCSFLNAPYTSSLGTALYIFRVAKPEPYGFLPAIQVMRRYHIQDRDDYRKYNKICGMITQLTNVLKNLDPHDKTRIELTDQLLNK